MSPILGIMASQISGHLSGPSYDSIATTTLSTATASITFSSIPATYTHLQIRMHAKGSRTIFLENALVTFNGDTTVANYNNHSFYSDGSTLTAGYSNEAGILVYAFAGSGGASGASVFGAGVIDVLDYANTNKYKTIRALGGIENNSTTILGFNSGLWANTNAITSITLVPTVGPNWLQYSSFALYGIKG